MRICGLNKLTLLDYPNKVACTIFTCGCNFACPFCHNKTIIGGCDFDEVSEDEVFEFLKKRKGILDGVCVSGGEPTCQPDLKHFILRIKDLGYLVKLDTNGSNLSMLKDLVLSRAVDYVAMDLKENFEQYERATGVVGTATKEVVSSFEFLMENNVDYEFRTTIVKGIHSKNDLVELSKKLEGAKQWYLQKYVESDNVLNKEGLSAFTDQEMKEFLQSVRAHCKNAQLRGVQ